MKRVTPRSGVSEFERKEIRKEGKVSIRRRGRTCVGSFAHANIQHPQAEEAERQKRKGTAANRIAVKAVQKGVSRSLLL
jgi:hypothetical protein